MTKLGNLVTPLVTLLVTTKYLFLLYICIKVTKLLDISRARIENLKNNIPYFGINILYRGTKKRKLGNFDYFHHVYQTFRGNFQLVTVVTLPRVC